MRVSSVPTIAILAAFVGLDFAQVGTPQAVSAQTTGGLAAVCMVRVVSGEGAQPTRIVIPAAAQTTMEAKGFELFECGSNGFGVAQQIEFRDKVCGMAANAPATVQRQLEIAMGERPAVLCGMAELVLGASVNGGGQGQ